MAALFETNRLRVRELEVSDFADFHEMQADDQVMRYTTGAGLSEAENRRQLEMCIDRYRRPENDFWVWAIIEKSSRRFVGTCAIVPNDQGPEIGYRFLRKYFGNGFGQEICEGLIDYGMHELRLEHIIAFADVRNVASVKILDRSVLRFVEEVSNESGGLDRFYRWDSNSAAG